jgi:hypothetical protein
MRSGFAGIDLAFAKKKRLPISVCTWQEGRLVPEALRPLPFEPPRGSGNAKVLNHQVVSDFAQATSNYLTDVCDHLDIRLERIAIDAPSAARSNDTERRAAEVAMDRVGISCFATPSTHDFGKIFEKVERHLDGGGAENRIPHANQLWMVVGFELFRQLSSTAPCIEVFPQATARVLGAGRVHKSQSGGVVAQLREAAIHTGWPSERPTDVSFEEIAFGPDHDRLDAYLSAWVGALEAKDRIAFGNPPDDVIWAPRVGDGSFERPRLVAQKGSGRGRRAKTGVQHDERFKRLCPACGQHQFQRWPYGWDSHAAHKCAGLLKSDPEERKKEFKSRFASEFSRDT